MSSGFRIEQSEIKQNIEALQGFIKDQKLDGFYVSSFDTFLNEYVPMIDCHRYYITNFSGSVAEVLVPESGRVKLYVDGRYHEQADLEVDATLVEVVKVPANTSLTQLLFDDIKKLNIKTIGIEAQRTSLGLFQKIAKNTSKVVQFQNEINTIIDFRSLPELAPITHETRQNRGKDTTEKLSQIISNKKTGYYITAIDSLAWLTNCRGYHLPNLSSFLGKGLAVHDKVYVYLDTSTNVDASAKIIDGIEFINIDVTKIESHIKDLQAQYQLDTLYIQPSMLNTSDYSFLQNVFGEKILTENKDGLIPFHSIKDSVEMNVMRAGFAKADQAIFNTIKWTKEQVMAGKKISEYDLFLETTTKYEAQGSKEQSFGTIAGVGPNGSIIHYGDPKKDVIINVDDMILLDSGGYFDGGFTTDTTRTYMASDTTPHADYKKIYTLVLKGLLQCQNAIFPDGCSGATLDAYARKPLYDKGYNYNHGTGHGVGIHVHEGGVRISPVSNVPMKAGQVVSIEPGIYIPGFAGVRLENICHVIKHPTLDGFLCFEPLVYIGFETSLIDAAKLTEQEMKWLAEYEEVCKDRHTSFL